jgi:hypothetical protein
MTLKEKLDREDGKRINLYKQGIFWTAYEQSAALLCRVKDLKVKVMSNKTNGRVLVVGFPEVTREHLQKIFGPMESEDDLRYGYFTQAAALTAEEMKNFRGKYLATSLDNQLGADDQPPSESAILSLIGTRIRTYPLSERTPMQAMYFLQELQRLLQTKNEI